MELKHRLSSSEKFSKTKENILMTMVILSSATKEPTIKIELLYYENHELYACSLDKKALKADEELWKFFDSPN